ncbi:MAG: hypothetical protein HYY18_00905 [Planctomycetes bacterium]|nr:hypothetical protein [Planctomycetota bacterium]
MSRRSLQVLFAALLLVPAGIASAQSPFFTENFDGVPAGTFPTGWSADPAAGTPLAGWSVDNTPALPGISTGKHGFTGGCYSAAVLPIPPDTQDTAPNSLNFNNGADLDNGALFSGAVDSPLIAVSSTAGVTVRFFCQFEALSCNLDPAVTGIGSDQRFVEIVDASGTVLLSIQMCIYRAAAGSPAPAPPPASDQIPPPPEMDVNCPEMFQPHFHVIDLSSLATTSFRIRFRMNETVEDTSPATFADTSWTGWFIDTVQVRCPTPDATAPTVPTQIFPAPAAAVTSPVAFDWTDSTDTGPCGPGSVSYILEIDDTATVPNPDVTVTPGTSSSLQVLAAGSYNWRVRAVDGVGNMSAFTADSAFTVEVNTPPLAPDGLQVNEAIFGAQIGDTGFVDPVLDERPVFSAVHHDSNVAIDFAASYRMQVSTDSTFTLVDFDSGTVALAPPLLDDTRCPDKTISISLQRDTVYFWRIQFTDLGGITGPFSIAQSFRIGDDFEFGVRPGSSNHSRKCWIATAAFGGPEAAPVAGLQEWRATTLESAAAGRLASRTYHTGGHEIAPAFKGSEVARGAIGTAGVAATPAGTAGVLLLALMLLGLGWCRTRK